MRVLDDRTMQVLLVQLKTQLFLANKNYIHQTISSEGKLTAPDIIGKFTK